MNSSNRYGIQILKALGVETNNCSWARITLDSTKNIEVEATYSVYDCKELLFDEKRFEIVVKEIEQNETSDDH